MNIPFVKQKKHAVINDLCNVVNRRQRSSVGQNWENRAVGLLCDKPLFEVQ
jgi:hypothetical protein